LGNSRREIGERRWGKIREGKNRVSTERGLKDEKEEEGVGCANGIREGQRLRINRTEDR
jgi:hypothetical protein